MNLIDWASDKVQTMTGEKDRRQIVQALKSTYDDYKTQATKWIQRVNAAILSLNQTIEELNRFRSGNISKNILSLGTFLDKFGTVKAIGEYAAEENVQYLDIPVQRFVEIKDYIKDVDWSKEDVFIKSFFQGIFRTASKTKEQNIRMQERLNSLKLEAEETLIELQEREFFAKQDKKIADLYMYCVKKIIEFIEKVIIPELDIVEGFFQALVLKNKVLANHQLVNIRFENSLEVIRSTQYEEHYLFVKNAFLFYVLACKIYNTPVLTNLLQGMTAEEDYLELEEQKNVLEDQIGVLNHYLMFERGEMKNA